MKCHKCGKSLKNGFIAHWGMIWCFKCWIKEANERNKKATKRNVKPRS